MTESFGSKRGAGITFSEEINTLREELDHGDPLIRGTKRHRFNEMLIDAFDKGLLLPVDGPEIASLHALLEVTEKKNIQIVNISQSILNDVREAVNSLEPLKEDTKVQSLLKNLQRNISHLAKLR